MLWFAGLSFLAISCKSTDKPAANLPGSSSEPVLFTVQGEPTSLKEFLYVYNKNNFTHDSLNRQEDLREYLDLYVNFKLKVQEAKESGMHTKQAFIDELSGYKKQLATPYLTEKAVTEKLIREAYERLSTEINASHILLGLKTNPEPGDTLAAYNKLMQLRERALSGEDFHALARQYSEDPSAGMNGGNLGYFTALQMVYPFENAAFQTKVGNVSMPVRTNFGYHLVKVHHKRPSQGKVKVAHIMVRQEENSSADEAAAAKEKIEEIYKRLKEEGDWARLAAQFSEDRSTRSKAGELDWFGTGSMVPAFEEATFALKQKGQLSAPVRTPYGWHIIRLLERQALPPLEEMREELEARVSRDSRAQLQETALLNRLREENKLVESTENIQAMISKADSTLLWGQWKYEADSLEAASLLFSINGAPYTFSDFYSWLEDHTKATYNISAQQYLKKLFEDWQDQELLAYEEAHLEDKYEEYRMLVQEYHDGILLFQLMDEKVWTKALEDTAGLKAFFQANRTDYQWKERVEGTLYSASGKEVLREVAEKINKPPYIWMEGSLSPLDTRQEALPANIARSLDKLASSLLQDTSAILEVYLPVKDRAAAGLIERQLQAHAIAASRYQLRSTDSGEARVRLLTHSPKALERLFNKKAALSLQVIEGPFERGTHPVVDAVKWEKGIHEGEEDGRAFLLHIQQVSPPAAKKLDEVRGQVISDYQQHLEQQWIDSLHQKYQVEINEAYLEQTLHKLDEQL